MSPSRVLTFVLVVLTACASSRAPGGGAGDDDDDVNVDVDAAPADPDASPAPVDAAVDAASTVDAATATACGAVTLETVAAWPKLSGAYHTAPAIAVGPNGELVAAYNVDEGPVIVAERQAGGGWTPSTVDTLGSFPSIAFAPDGTLHVCYERARSDSSGPLECASRPPGGEWSRVTVDGNGSKLPSVAVDAFGRLNVAYVRIDGFTVASRSSSGGWSLSTTTASWPEGASLTYDALGREYIVWTSWSDGLPTLFERATGFVDGTHDWVRPRSLAVDGAGRVHVLFARHRDQQLSYAYRDADHVWHFEHNLDGEGLIAPWTMALAIGAGGEAHASYHARATTQEPERVLHAVRGAGTWTTETLHESTTGYRSTTAMAATSDGHVHIVFDALPDAEADQRTVYYVRRCSAADPP